MGKYILYAGILSAALDYGANAAEGHLFSFIEGKDMRAENGERLAAVCGEKVYKRLGNKKYLIRNGEQIVMLDMEDLAEREVINWELVERIEKDATENLRKMRENGDFQKNIKKSRKKLEKSVDKYCEWGIMIKPLR